MDDPDHNLNLTGIKIEYKNQSFNLPPGEIYVAINLSGCGYGETDSVDYEIKAGDVQFNSGGILMGPLACDPGIPEFSTIAIPVAAVLGLLFFFNHRKKRREH